MNDQNWPILLAMMESPSDKKHEYGFNLLRRLAGFVHQLLIKLN